MVDVPPDSSLRYNLSLRTSDIPAKLPPQLKSPLLKALIPTMPTVPVVRPSDEEQRAAILVVVPSNDNRHVKPSGILKVQSLKEGKMSEVTLHICRTCQPCQWHHKGTQYLCGINSTPTNVLSPWLEVVIPISPAVPVVPPSDEQQASVLATVHQDNGYIRPPVTFGIQSLKEGKVSGIFL